MQTNRTLTDEDIEAITVALEKKMTHKIYHDLGKGLFGMIWKGILIAVISIAAYGAAHQLK
jgi:hypothetical protein